MVYGGVLYFSSKAVNAIYSALFLSLFYDSFRAAVLVHQGGGDEYPSSFFRLMHGQLFIPVVCDVLAA